MSAAGEQGPESRLAELSAALDRERALRVQAEERLRELEERHRLLVDGARDYAMFLIDAEGRISSWNEGARRLLGYTPEEAVGQHMELTFTEEDRRAGKPRRELDVARARGTVREENWAVRKDGSRFWASGFTRSLPDQGGARGFVKVFRDLTERKQMEEQLRRARDELERRVEERTAELRRAERLAAIGQTVAALAHESRNAIQRGQTYLERLSWRLQGQEEALGLLAEARKAQEDLLRLYEDVRGYAAPVQLEYRRCDLAAVWRQAWERLAPLRAGRDARLEEHTGGLDLACEADPFRLEQVFRNILDNSLAACPDPVVITVACAEDELEGRPALTASVRDNGPGLGEEQRRRIFEPFFTTKTSGTGLGMAIAARVVEAHGGRIAVGEAGGLGAEIILTLPRRRA